MNGRTGPLLRASGARLCCSPSLPVCDPGSVGYGPRPEHFGAVSFRPTRLEHFGIARSGLEQPAFAVPGWSGEVDPGDKSPL